MGYQEKALPDRHQGTACTPQIRKPPLTHSGVMYTAKDPQLGAHPISEVEIGMAILTQAMATSDHQEDCSFML